MSTADGVALEAGRELDARVARELGLALEVPCARYHRTDEADYDSRDGWSGWCYTCGVSICEVAPVARPYSTDIAAAFEVVDRLIAAGLWVLLDIIPGNAEVTISEGEAGIAAGYSDSLPLAICRASLHPGVVEHLERLRP